MSIYLGFGTKRQRVSRKNRLRRSSLITVAEVWDQIKGSIGIADHEIAKALLWQWRGEDAQWSFEDISALAETMNREIHDSKSRENYYYRLEGENFNVDKVIYRSSVAQSSAGWSNPKFFQELGHPRNKRWEDERITSRTLAERIVANEGDKDLCIQGLKRRAEQEYLLMNMVKGAMLEASEIAAKFNMGIAVRGTGLLAHMGIESGDPTKAQEFKNKTSKDEDVYLCEEMEWKSVGAVVHYDPRIEWDSKAAAAHAEGQKPPMFRAPATEADWEKKKLRIQQRIKAGKYPRQLSAPDWDKLKGAFMARSKEYMEEDYEYRKGHFAPFCVLVGPYIRLKQRQDVNMVGDHDLFAFTTDRYGVFAPGHLADIPLIQTALQKANTFQAQHGGIWYWVPKEAFHKGIKDKIMGAHSPNGDEPLVYIRPGGEVTAAYFLPDTDCLQSVWDNAGWTSWMKKTHSGSLLLNPPTITDDE